MVRRLLASGADPNVRLVEKSRVCEATAIDTASYRGRLNTISLLIDSGVVTDGPGRRPYIEAVVKSGLNGHTTTLQLLVSHRSWIRMKAIR
ncbi:hypothetical protein F5Y00DRAFT_248057 [Daldinia vernicosa]|uniref:uncharacterized protein n=1 Tax=Daldinia vernicosa TaxID=114800 RepID=UPI002008CAB3|nr:uncharacterized protein F5Y00DRAFT_248057 [Daldinia vernicosa]KAI0844738.1 hypothetical protein F5Y00DRAFT_248057 [Daldinia vernicosa]